MSSRAIFTIISNNYSAYATTLMASVREVEPDCDTFVCLVDEEIGDPARFGEGVTVVRAVDLGIDQFQDMALRYDVMELNTSVKPFMFLHLLEKEGYDQAIYMDPDTWLIERLADVDDRIATGASAVLTPHLLAPLEDALMPDDHAILKSGVYNLGFAAFSNKAEARDFLKWWSHKLRFQGQSDIPNNLFTDQRWCDMAPCFMEKLAILRHPGHNVAYWNLANRQVRALPNGTFEVDGHPLVFFHFSGLVRSEPKLVSKHQNRLQWQDLGSLQPLFQSYRAALESHGWASDQARSYAYGTRNGLKIGAPIRSLYRKLYPDRQAMAELDRDFLLRLCNQPVQQDLSRDGLIMTELMLHVHESRPDLQAAFPFGTLRGIKAYVRWFEQTAGREYGLDEAVTQQAQIAGHRHSRLSDAAVPPVPNAGRSRPYRLWRKWRKSFLNFQARF